MLKVYLLAHPAGHSLSPAMHNAAFAALGINAHYQAKDIPPEALAAAVAELRAPEVLGANVTIPHKVAILPHLDALSDTASAIGAVNTVINQSGRLIGHNTDASGFIRALRELGGVEPRGQRAVVLGAGGAARAVVYGLLAQGAEVALYNRTAERAAALARALHHLGSVRALSEGELADAVRRCTLLVNATSVGMAQGASPLPKGLLPERGTVVDLIYRPARTQLLAEAEAAGLATQNGLAMLALQGAEALTCWTGREAPLAVMLAALNAALHS